jgi:hypothetical protein
MWDWTGGWRDARHQWKRGQASLLVFCLTLSSIPHLLYSSSALLLWLPAWLQGGKAAAETLQQAGSPGTAQPIYGPGLPGQAEASGAEAAAGAAASEEESAAPAIMKREGQAQVLRDLERGYQEGLRRQMQSGRTVGLGL